MAQDSSDQSPSRRGQDRRVVLKGAKAVFNNGKSVLICRVRDLSPGGAKLEFPPRQELPEFFELHVAGQPVGVSSYTYLINGLACQGMDVIVSPPLVNPL